MKHQINYLIKFACVFFILYFEILIIINISFGRKMMTFTKNQIYYAKFRHDEAQLMLRDEAINRNMQNKIGHWTEKQNAKYYSFLRKFKEKFGQKESRRQWKVFKVLSQFVKTRNANQCRSHHYKMQKNHKNIDDTLLSLQQKNPNMEAKYQKYIQQLNNLSQKIFQQCHKNSQEVDNSHNQCKKARIDYQYPYYQFFKNLQAKKPGSIENSKTNIFYEDEEQYLRYQQQIEREKKTKSLMDSIKLIKGAQSEARTKTEMINPNTSKWNQKLLQPKVEQKQIYKNNHKIELSEFQQKLLECHLYFARWCHKLNDTLSKSNSMRYYQFPANVPTFNFN